MTGRIVRPRPLPWARVDPATGLSLLFRPLPKNGSRPKLNVVYRHGDELELRFSAANALGIPEQTLLLAILQLAGEAFLSYGSERVLDGSCEDDVAALLWSALFPRGAWAGAQSLYIATTWDELNLRTGNLPGGSANKARRQSLVWLCEVVVWERYLASGVTRQSYLVRWLTGDDRRIHLALNPRLAAGFFGQQHARVSMTERLRLRADLHRAVHAFLSTSIRPGHQLHIRPQTLAARMWPDNHATAPASTIRRRHGELVRALNAMAALAQWGVSWSATGVATVLRREGQGASGTSPVPRTACDSDGCAVPAGQRVRRGDSQHFDISGLLR